MTICIAAVCDDGPHQVIILCADTKGSSPLGTTHLSSKQSNLGDDWACLSAGSEDECNAMLPIFRQAFTETDVKDETKIVERVQSCLRKRKIEKANDFTGGKWGLSYEEFRRARSDFPQDQFDRDMAEIANFSLGADFIIAGFLEDAFPILLETDRTGAVKIRENYCVIGEGSYLAQASLMHRDHTEHHPFARALYCVFEAKKYAERISTVGPETRFTIFAAGVSPLTITPEAEAHLSDMFEKHGPKELVEDEHQSVPEEFLVSAYAAYFQKMAQDQEE